MPAIPKDRRGMHNTDRRNCGMTRCVTLWSVTDGRSGGTAVSPISRHSTVQGDRVDSFSSFPGQRLSSPHGAWPIEPLLEGNAWRPLLSFADLAFIFINFRGRTSSHWFGI